MPVILTKKSDTPGSIPSTANLTNLAGGAELAVNTADKRLFSMNSSSAIIEVGTNPSSLTCADASFTVARVGSLTISSLSLTNATFTSATITTLTSTSAGITTLTSSSATISTTLALSGGTANGVLYLNGSKVATSGSGLTFDGTTLTSNGGFKAAGNASSLAVDGAILDFNANYTRLAAGRAGGNFSSFELYVAGASGVTKRFDALYDTTFRWFDSAGTGELMRLNSTGLGIGTTSPESKLAIKGASGDADLFSISDTTVPTSGAEYGVAMIKTNSTEYALNITGYNAASKGLRIYNNGQAAARTSFSVETFNGVSFVVDGVGNAGLGVTPSAWSGITALEMPNGTSLGAYSSSAIPNTYLGANNFYNGTNFIYKVSSYRASQYRLASTGEHQWLIAPSGTAGNAITFTQAMTLDASGRLQLGTTSVGGMLTVKSPATTIYGEFDCTTDGYGYLTMKNGTTTCGYVGPGALTTGNQMAIASAGSLPLTFGTNGSERARITSGGLFFVNTTTSSGFGDGHRIFLDVAENTTILSVDGGTEFSAQFRDVTGGGYSTAGTAIIVGKNSSTSRSINAGGTVNASGADYAEYMEKAGEFVIAKGDVCGIDADGKLTNVYANAVAFVVKSTNPSYVGGDSWGAGYKDDPEGLEAARQKVDRIAFSGQVPVNVLGAVPGQYIVPVNDNGAIKGVAVSNPSFEQYQTAVGKVIAIEDDGRARIIVKIA